MLETIWESRWLPDSFDNFQTKVCELYIEPDFRFEISEIIADLLVP